MKKKSLVTLTGAEWSVIKAVWEKEPCTAPEIQQRLDPQTGWTYSTVRTLMDRMTTKGLLLAEKVRNLTHYRSAVTREQAQRSEVLYALKHAFNGAPAPMVQCLIETRDLSPDELAAIERMINQRKHSATVSKPQPGLEPNQEFLD